MAAQSTAVNATAGPGAQVVFPGPCTFRGLAISSVAGADVVLYDNASAAAGTVIAAFTVGAKGFQPMDVSDGVHCNNGIYMTATAAVTGNVRIG
jgi:hypothetical protein